MDPASQLLTAARKGNVELAKSCLARGALINATYYENGIYYNKATTPLHEAARYHHLPLLELFLQEGADINIKNNYQSTPLREATIEHILRESDSNQKVIEFLLKQGADVDAKSSSGDTLLHEATYGKNQILIKLLLNAGADVNAKNKDGNTPLYIAALKSKRTTMLLLAQGAIIYRNTQHDNTFNRLQKRWTRSIDNTSADLKFYTLLLLSGVSVPADTVLPETLQTVQFHIEATVSDWLAPLSLSREKCAKLTSRVLRLLPHLREWINFISRSKAQDFGNALFDALTSNEPNKMLSQLRYKIRQPFEQHSKDKQLLKAFGKKMPNELWENVQELFKQKTLLGLLADRMQTYGLPSDVAEYLVEKGWHHPEDYADFHRKILTHDWLAKPCAPPGQSKLSIKKHTSHPSNSIFEMGKPRPQ